MATKKITIKPETGEIFINGKLQTGNNLNGYLQYTISLGFSQGVFAVYGHCLVYLWLYGTYSPELVVDHIDRDRSNNRKENLRCITQRENVQHTPFRKPWTKQNERGPQRLPEDMRRDVFADSHNGMSFVKIAKKYNITRQSASRIANEQFNLLQKEGTQQSFDFINPLF